MRMDWSEDKRVYQPRIHSDRIEELHAIREEGEFMTVMIDQAIEEFCNDRLFFKTYLRLKETENDH